MNRTQLCALLVFCSLSGPLRSDGATYKVDSDASRLRIVPRETRAGCGLFAGIVQQKPGSLEANIEGTLNIESIADSVEFGTGSQIWPVPRDDGPFDPIAALVDSGSTHDHFAGQDALGGVAASVVVRDALVEILPGTVSRDGGLNDMLFRFAGGTFDYRQTNFDLTVDFDFIPLTTLVTTPNVSTDSISISESGQLTIPVRIDQQFATEFEDEEQQQPILCIDGTLNGRLVMEGQLIANLVESEPGDFNGDGQLTNADVNELMDRIRLKDFAPPFDLVPDNRLDFDDLAHWVTELRGTQFGDANLNGVFDSADVVQVFQVGRYETDQPANWQEGDWNADGRFTTKDLVVAFQFGNYIAAAQSASDVQSVPEPGVGLVAAVISLALVVQRRSRC